MDFRIINDETLPKIMELWDYCFEKNDTPFFKWYFNEYCLKENMVLGGFDEKSGKIVNMLHLNPYTINLRGRYLKLPYIVGVATAPEYRGRHLFAPLLETAFSVLRAQGQAFVLLMPISAVFTVHISLITVITGIVTRCLWPHCPKAIKFLI